MSTGQIEKVSTEKHEGDITSVAYRNGYVFTGGADGKLKVWDKDLNLKKTVDIQEAYIICCAVNSKGKVYASGSDGSVKFCENPIESDEVKELVRCDDLFQSMICVDDVLYTGDDKGVVTKWENDKISFKYNLVEEVMTLAVEQNLIYTARNLDVVVSEIMAGKSGKYTTKATIPGRYPLTLLGPLVDDRRTYLAFADRDGKGVCLVKNQPGANFAKIWTKEDCHEMIINSICGTDTYLYTGGYDGRVKWWTELDKSSPKLAGDVLIGNCINSICVGPDDKTIFSGTSDGIVRRFGFA